MPPKRNRVQGGNAKSRASAVPQGDRRRRARSEFEGDTDQPAATHIRVEEARRPQWTMRSTVEDILLKGGTNMADMKLNEFIRSYLGEEWVVERNGNVAMEAFVQDPETFIKKKRLLSTIKALPSYQVLEAINKLNHEGVHFLEQWKDYEGKDTVTLLVCEKLNGVLIQVLREERLEAEERAVREEHVGFTLTTTIRGVLFKGRVRFMDIKLNDFLTLEMEGRGILHANRNVLLRDFFSDPTRYIPDARVLVEVQKKGYYLSLESTVREEMDLEEDVRKLHHGGVDSLFGWSRAAEGVKASVRGNTKNSLDAAFEVARIITTTSAAMKLEGLYESVYNASWHHVVEIPGGEGTGMEVKEGEPPQSWTYKEDGNTLEKDDGVEQSGEAPPVLMVLTSDKGWPYTMNLLHGTGNDLCVNCEVERAWQIVKGDLTKWFSTFHLTLNPSPLPRVLIGTPGIGKSMNAGSYLLYQLLHYDVEKIQVVAHCFGSVMYVFDKTAKTVSKYVGSEISIVVLGGLWQCGMKGYIIYDVAKKGTPPDTGFAPSTGWGMIVVSSPKLTNYDEWEKQAGASRIVMNCPDEMDVKAMCTWMKRGLDKDEQAGYWKKVKKRMKKVGPIPRHVFDEDKYIIRLGAVNAALVAIKDIDVGEYFTLGEEKEWYSKNPSHKLVKIVRARTKKGVEVFLNASISADVGLRLADRLAKKMATKDILLLILGSRGALASRALEQLGLRAFMYGELVIALLKELNELPPPSPSEPQDSVLKINHQGHPTRTVGLKELEGGVERITMEYGVLYIPAVENFPLVDGFFFVNSPRKTLVGLQMTTASAHHTITSTVKQFTERLSAYFNDWEELSRDMSWEIIYIYS
ncbi:putative retrotransposon hot spot (RHS) protein, partial [Trypanosoma cruzi]